MGSRDRKSGGRGFKSRPRHHSLGSGASPSALKSTRSHSCGDALENMYGYESAIRRYRRIIGGLRNGKLALSFLDHLACLGLSKARIAKYAEHAVSQGCKELALHN